MGASPLPEGLMEVNSCSERRVLFLFFFSGIAIDVFIALALLMDALATQTHARNSS